MRFPFDSKPRAKRLPLFVGGLLSAALAVTVLFGCESSPLKTDASDPAETSDLTQEDAALRSQRLGQIRSHLQLTLNETDSQFMGVADLHFELKQNTQSLRLDLFEGQVQSMILNGQALPSSAKKKFWIELPASSLKPGDNEVVIRYSTLYSTEGRGLHRFVDPETKQVFLYSQFQAFDAHRMMPCFDQPDLKMSLQLEVSVPASWQVISTMPESTVQLLDRGLRKTWTFPPTPALATDVLSVHAGPYQVWEDLSAQPHLRLFARPSMAKYLRPLDWFRITRQGLKFYQDFFRVAYPFPKYDQLIVPEFNAGAMENVGAVTFTETYISRGPFSAQQWRFVSNTLLHEMAHMWFGDLVTMRWYNDLWLNESFATYLSALAQSRIFKSDQAWVDFFLDNKADAYDQDTSKLTHPIEAPIPNVHEAFTNFDSITYGKGAAVLKQLHFWIGEKAFQQGIHDHLKRYAYANATSDDFIASLQGQTQQDLQPWAQAWLRQSGLDQWRETRTCENGRVQQIELALNLNQNFNLHPQKIRLGFYQLKDQKLIQLSSKDVDLRARLQGVSIDEPCPAFVTLNEDDQGLLLTHYSDADFDFIQNHLHQIPSALVRAQIWDQVWRDVQNAERPLQVELKLFQDQFFDETNETLLKKTFDDFKEALAYLPKPMPELLKDVETRAWSQFEKAEAGSDRQRFWFDVSVESARTPEALNQLAQFYNHSQIGEKFPWDQDRRWKVIKQLSRYGHPSALGYRQVMEKSDVSDRGQREAASSRAIVPSAAVKQALIKDLLKAGHQTSFAQAEASMATAFPFEQKKLARPFEKEFYRLLSTRGMSEDELWVEALASTLIPLNCEKTASQKLQAFLNTKVQLTAALRKSMLMQLELDERCQKIRQRSGF